MSQPLHFIALTAALFVSSYTGVTWVMAGAPLVSVPFAQQETRVAALPVSPPAQRPVQQAALQRAIPQPALPPGDGDPQRDRLRFAALQASTDYAQTPCNDAAKAAMLDAVSAYAQAWAEMMDCGPNGCDYKKINLTAAVFSTPLDIQVRDAVGVAFDKRGISIDDFPSALRINVAMLVRGRGAPATGCAETRVQVIGR
jgi:hypothetical protein